MAEVDERTTKEIADLNLVLKEVNAQVGKAFSKIPANVLDLFFGEALNREFFFDKDGNLLTGGQDVVYSVVNDNLVRSLNCDGEIYFDVTVFKTQNFDTAFSPKKMKSEYGIDIDKNSTPRAVLIYCPKPRKYKDEDGVKKVNRVTIEKVLYSNKILGNGPVLTVRKEEVFVPEQRILKDKSASLSENQDENQSENQGENVKD